MSMLRRHGWIAGVAVLTSVVAWGTLSGAGMRHSRALAREAAAEADVGRLEGPGAERPRGRFRRARAGPADTDEADALDDVEALAALGYVSGSREAGDRVSVTVHDRQRAWQGVNLYTSGHANEALLVDMDGRVLHTWRYPVEQLWPDEPVARAPTGRFWRRAALLPEGDLLAIYEGVGIVRLDRDSNVRWSRLDRAHHDLQVLPDGRIVLLARVTHDRKDVAPYRPVVEDFYVVLGPDGEELERVSLLDAYRRSAFEDHWLPRARRGGDVFHTNAVGVLDGRLAALDPAFAAGNVLLSMRNLGTIAILDPRAETIVWSRTGDWSRQHDPHLLDGGHLLVFDNGGERGISRALELGPEGAVAWSWDGPPSETMWTACCGTAQRLPNGNTLVTESEAGRAFEVTPLGAVVWRFDSPHRSPDDQRLVATLFEVLRLPDEGLEWVRP